MSNEFGDRLPSSPSDEKELVAIRYKAVVDRHVASAERVEKALATDVENELALFKSMHEKIREAAASRVGKRTEVAELVQKAAAAIVTLYSGLLAIVFVAGQPIPLRAVYPAVFLGLAVVLATGYAAFLSQPGGIAVRLPRATSSRESVLSQTQTFLEWVSAGILHRAHMLRTSVIALALGLIFLPAPFVSTGPAVEGSNSGGSVAVTAALPTWPPDPGTDAGRQVILQAQVAEVAKIREQAITAASRHDPRADELGLQAFGIGMFLLIIFGLVDWWGSRRRPVQ